MNKMLHYNVFGRQFIEQEAVDQMENAMKLPISVQGALMPDAHSGYGLPIGGVLATYNAVIPYGVGMDIGCRMCLSVYKAPANFIEKNRKKLKKILIENTRFGRAEFNDINEHEIMERDELHEVPFLKSLKDTVFAQLGTSGTGNHFVDFGLLEVSQEIKEFELPTGKYFAVLSHSGSRNFGAQVARHYTEIAGKKREIKKGATHLAWLNLDEEEGIEYWKAMTFAGDFATANHEIIHNRIGDALKMQVVHKVQNHHNFAWKEQINDKETLVVHRKGATPAHKGVTGIIPGSMATPGFVVRGLGNKTALNSASHGAGRKMSRKKAKTTFKQKDMQQILKKEGIELLGGGLDENPLAYKDIHKVMHHQKELVEILAVFHPKLVRMCSS